MYLPVLDAFMDPLVGLYDSLSPTESPSDNDLKEKASKVGQEIRERFAKEV